MFKGCGWYVPLNLIEKAQSSVQNDWLSNMINNSQKQVNA